MGALLSQPLTEKDSNCGEFKLGSRQLTYGATGMQGWRMSMEDVKCVIPKFDEKTSLFAVYDGHGGKEVALYCNVHIPELLLSSSAYKSGNIPFALQKTFLECDRLLTAPQAIEEMDKLLLNDRKDQGCEDEEIDTSRLMEEAKMPLEDLLGQYAGAKQLLGNMVAEGDPAQEGDEDNVASMLKMLASRVGITIDFEDSEDSSVEEEDGEGNGKAGSAEEEEEEEEEEEDVDEEGVEEEVSKKENNFDDDDNDDEVGCDDDNDGSTSERKGKSKEANYKHHHSSRKGASHFTGAVAEASVTSSYNTSEQSAAELCGNAREGVACTNSGPSANAGGGHNHVHSTLFSNSLSKEEGLSDEEEKEEDLPNGVETTNGVKTTNGIGTMEGTVYKKNACLRDLLTSGVNHTHNNHVGTMEESPGKGKRKEPTSAELYTSKKPCRLSDDDDDDDIASSMGIHSGTTAVLCLVRENQLIVANTGDSRCVLSCKGECVDMSEDHKPTDAPELCRIKQAGGEVGTDGRVNGGLNVSRAIGDHFYKKNSCLPLAEQMITAMPDVRIRDISDEDEFIVLACDGIWNVMSSQEAVDFVRVRLSEQLANGTHDIANICENLCDACLAPSSDNDGTGCDNMTCIIVLLQSPSEFLQNEL